MSAIAPYSWARRQLDSHVYKIRLAVEKGVERMVQAAWAKFQDGGTRADDDAVRGMVAAYRESVHRQILLAHTCGIAALVALIRPQRKLTGKTRAVVTRNRRAKRTRTRKAFPSDSSKRGALNRYTKHRQKFRARWIGTWHKAGSRPDGLPKLAVLSEKKRGRPRLPDEVRQFTKKVARCRALKIARAITARKRKEKGWKTYPYPRKPVGEPQGWSDYVHALKANATLAERVREVRRKNVEHLKRETEARRKAWDAAH